MPFDPFPEGEEDPLRAAAGYVARARGVIGDAEKVQAGITASTTQTQGQQPLTGKVNEVSTVAVANDVVTMTPAAASTEPVRVINNGANVLQIFPASGNDLGAGVDTSVTLATGGTVVSFIFYNSVDGRPI